MNKQQYLHRYALELIAQASMPKHSTSALINMLSKAILKDTVFVECVEEQLMLSLTNYWKHRAFHNKALQLNMINEISNYVPCKYAITSAIEDTEMTIRNVKSTIKLSLSRIADALLQLETIELQHEIRNN
jgi:hypothetical protein